MFLYFLIFVGLLVAESMLSGGKWTIDFTKYTQALKFAFAHLNSL